MFGFSRHVSVHAASSRTSQLEACSRIRSSSHEPLILPHDFSILFLFSLLFNLSTRFLCIFCSSISYLSLSTFFSRFSLIRLTTSSLVSCFSAFISASLAFVAARATCAACRLAYGVREAVGRNALRVSCQFFPGQS